MKKVTLLFLMLGVLGLTACGTNNSSQNNGKPVIEVRDDLPQDLTKPCYGENQAFVFWVDLREDCSNYPYTTEEFNQFLNGEWNE